MLIINVLKITGNTMLPIGKDTIKNAIFANLIKIL